MCPDVWVLVRAHRPACPIGAMETTSRANAAGETCSESLALRPITGRKARSGPEVEADLALFQLQTGVEGPSGLRLEALEHRAHAPTEQRLRHAGADPLAGDRLPDGELAPAPPAAAAVRLLLFDDLRAAQGAGAEPARGRRGRLFALRGVCTRTRRPLAWAVARPRAFAHALPSLARRRPLRPASRDRDLGERARIRQAEDHLSWIAERHGPEQDPPLQKLPDLLVPQPVAPVFPPEHERAALIPAGAAEP